MKMTLKEVCNMVGVTRRAIQGYEQVGLVASSEKNKYGYLLYDEVMIEKIRMIKQYQDFGFKVKEIKELLESSDEICIKMLSIKLEKMRTELDSMKKNIEKMEQIIVQKTKRG